MQPSNPRIDTLRTFTWSNAAQPPAILSAHDAYAARNPAARYYRVAWWDDLPAGFTRFDWLGGEVEGGYPIMLRTEPRDFETVLTYDEIVMVFTDKEGEQHAHRTD